MGYEELLAHWILQKNEKKIVNMNTLTTVPDACIQPGECLVLNAPKPGLG